MTEHPPDVPAADVPAAGVLAARTFPRLYRDSVSLMALAARVEKEPGVLRAGVVMGTPANLEILARSGMRPHDLRAGADDLVIVVRAESPDVVDSALAAAQEGLTAAQSGDPGTREETPPGTVAEGLAEDPDLTVACVSTPGAYAPVVAEQALRRGLHVFCFSDNVPLAEEIRLKRLAVERRLLFMGPDCGTAVLDGVPLGFANVLRPGPVAIVAASGTGPQEVSCLLDSAGAGVSQIVGVGGHDLSADVGGLMTGLALDLVAEDAGTELVVLVSKPPARATAERLLERLARLGKPAVACLVGAEDADGPVPVRGTLEGGALAAAALLGADLGIAARGPAATPAAGTVLGLYTGGTLAAEAEVVLRRAGVPAEVVDFGDDEYTAGRPHPMIDPAARAQHVAAAGRRADVGVVLLDCVLGYGASPDPATPLAEAVASARDEAARDGRLLVAVGSVTGTDGDPQQLAAQRRILGDAGVVLLPSNAAAARHAAACALAAPALAAQEAS
jgi:FdrA protein